MRMPIKNGNNKIIFGLKTTNKGYMAIQPIKKFKKLDSIELKGRISRGILNWRRILCLFKIDSVASDKADEKNIQGKSPESTNKEKFFISVLKITEKTKVIANIIKSGLIKAKNIPRPETAYLDFSCFNDISQRV